MRKRKAKKGTGSDVQRAAFEATPDMAKLDEATRNVLKVPKAELDRRIAAEKERGSRHGT